MEFCVARLTGRIISAKADGAVWGSGESYGRWIEAGLEAARWMERRIFVLKVPELTELDGYRYGGGLVDLDWLALLDDPEPELSLAEWMTVALPELETDPE